jgi:hypothetical protein
MSKNLSPTRSTTPPVRERPHRIRPRTTQGEAPADAQRDIAVILLSVNVERMSTERRADPFGLVALAAAGTMSAHELGYLTHRSPDDGAHAYFGVLGPLALLALCVVGWIAALRIVQRDAGRAPSLVALTGLQVGGYLAMEIGERLFTDSAPALLSPPVLAGLALQPAIAWTALRLLTAGRRIIEALFVDVTPPLQRGSVTTPTPVHDLVGTLLPRRLRVRGPPVR